MADFPVYDATLVDPELEARMEVARTVVSLVLLLRNKARINVRQPLRRILLVEGLSGVRRERVEAVRDIILDEVNVKAIEFIQDAASVVTRTAKANFKTLGPKLGKRMKAAAARIAALQGETLNAFVVTGSLMLELEGEALLLSPEDLEIVSEEVGGWSVAQEGHVTVALDIEITPALKRQGYARELINRIQQMRKALDLALTDRVALEIAAVDAFQSAVEEHRQHVMSEVLATDLRFTAQPVGGKVEACEIGELVVTIGLTRTVAT
jgi:isoleucyl-tRNA synthetase